MKLKIVLVVGVALCSHLWLVEGQNFLNETRDSGKNLKDKVCNW